MKSVLYWLPRILSLLLVIFLGLFALDTLSGPQWLLGLLIHLIPSSILLVVTIFAWKHAKIGGYLFFIFGLCLLVFTHLEAWFIAVPSLIIGSLFLAGK